MAEMLPINQVEWGIWRLLGIQYLLRNPSEVPETTFTNRPRSLNG